MRSLAAYGLAWIVLLQSLLPGTTVALLRSPEVWEHYKEHQTESVQPLDFRDFLIMHYSINAQHTKEKKHHLPSYELVSVAGLFTVPSAEVLLSIPGALYLSNSNGFAWNNSYFFLGAPALICPPRG